MGHFESDQEWESVVGGHVVEDTKGVNVECKEIIK